MKKLASTIGTCLGTGLGCMACLLVFALIAGVSWAATCGIFYLITLCFGLRFSWALGTGVWLITILLGSIFGSSDKK